MTAVDNGARFENENIVRLYFVLIMPGDYCNLKLYYEITLDLNKIFKNTEFLTTLHIVLTYCVIFIRIAFSR